MITSAATTPEQDFPAPPGELLTRRAVTAITAAIVVMTFAFSLGNVTHLCLDLGITAWIAWLVGPAVDLSVVGLLTGMRFLSLHGYADAQLAKLQRMLRFCGLLTLALNTAGALGHRQFGTALVDAVGPALLIGWSETGPWLLRQIHAVCPPAVPRQPAAPQQPEAAPAPALPLVLPAALLARTRELDAEHRATTGRPISRDNLRAQLRIGRDRASALVAAVRADAGLTMPSPRPFCRISHGDIPLIYHPDIGLVIALVLTSLHEVPRTGKEVIELTGSPRRGDDGRAG